MNKVFITGVAGFLGSHIAEKFLTLGWEVVGIDSLIGGDRANVPDGVEFFESDLAELEGLSEKMHGCNLVYHTACTAYEGLSVFSPSLVSLNTFQISVNTMTAAIQAGVKRVIHCSSMARYGEQKTHPFNEDMIPSPQDPYGIAKLAAEKSLENLAQIFGLELVIAVPHNIIGSRQKYDDPYRNVASIMINRCLQGKPPVIYGDGSQVRCFSDIEDVIDALALLATSSEVIGQVFNIGPDTGDVTISELASMIMKLTGYKGEATFTRGRPQEVKHATCSADKMRRYFDYNPRVSLEESLCRMIEYVKQQGVRDFVYHLPLEIVDETTPETWLNRKF